MGAINEKLLKPYEPKETEERIYELWKESGFFNPDNLPGKREKPFTIIMPPPNANGRLHAGHAVVTAIEDLLTRYKRMRGFKALWLPGADHAGFETQVVYEKKLEKEGRSRFKMDPKELYDEIMDFTMGNKKFMERQLEQLGASCDWSRKKFTLDEDIVKIVYETFKQLNDDELLYRGKRAVNWCAKHQTSLSDLETDEKELTDKLYYIKYGPFVVATVRPETIFGDVAVAVNPKDERYKRFVGQEIEVEIPTGKLRLKVVADDAVDMEFGTGALKITPAHDANDFALAQRRNLPAIEVIDRYGKLNEKTGKYQGMNALKAREEVARDLEKMGLLEKIEEYEHSVPVCYKCKRTLEPRIMEQWFVKMKPLADKAIEAIEKKEIVFYPDNFRKIILHWLENIIDWNISRQIVWGIPIPAKKCSDCGEWLIDIKDEIANCEKCGGKLEKDKDTFDTWFSSGQWPFAALGYPDGEDFKTYYPTDVMETAGEIIFFWVARMIMLGKYRTGEIPFRVVYLNGLVRDGKGQKMSKSKGNVIDPIDLTEKYGTDALRMSLIIGVTPGTDMNLSEDKIKAYKHFANKIWNASRFTLSAIEGVDLRAEPELKEKDKAALAELSALAEEVTDDLENFRLHLAGEKLYHYFWHTFADRIIEEAKPRIAGEDSEDKRSAQYALFEILKTCLKLLHPFMPFITEEIWGMLPREGGSTRERDNLLIVEKWPIQ